MKQLKMEMETFFANRSIRLCVEKDIEPLDILHTELKNLMLEAQEVEERTEWLKGYEQALVNVYTLTYALSFMIGERERWKQ